MIGNYKGRNYNVNWYGRWRDGRLRAKLGFLNSIIKNEFWADAELVKVGAVPVSVLIEQEDVRRSAILDASRATGEDAEPESIPTLLPLRPFQVSGVNFAQRVIHPLIADEQGLGKTVQALGLMEAELAYPALVICPASVKIKWTREVVRFTGRKALWLGGIVATEDLTAEELTAAEVVVINYDWLNDDWLEVLESIPWQTLVLDESHYIRTRGTQRTKAAKQLAALPSLRHKICLTGTPIINRPVELVQPLMLLGHLTEIKRDTGTASLGTVWNFMRRYCDAKKTKFGWDFSGATNLAELNMRLRQTCMIRRMKSEVLKELPAKTRVTLPVQLSNRVVYNRIDSEFTAWLQEKTNSRPDLKALPRVELIDRLMAIAKAETIIKINALMQACGTGKIEPAIQFIEDFLETGQKLVVFAYHSSVQEALVAKFPGALTIFGGDSPERRDLIANRFQTGDDQLLITYLDIIGVDLYAASHGLIVEYVWTPSKLEQAEDRLHRIGQESETPVTIYYLHADKTFDDTMVERLTEKAAVIKAITS